MSLQLANACHVAGQTAPFDWPTSADWQQVKVELPETNCLIHLRITPPRSGTGLEIPSIELRAYKGEPRVWRFNEMAEGLRMHIQRGGGTPWQRP